jgi:dolichyl-phosphate beta-glucosyltransferase
MGVSIVVPAYNEALRLPGTLNAIGAYLAETRTEADVIVVDDGSVDGTASLVRDLARSWDTGNLEVISYLPNRGKGAAVREGVLAARQDVVLMTDADMSTPISEMPKLLAAIDGGASVAVGSRYLDRQLLEVRQPLYRELSASLYNRAVQRWLIPGIRDTQCGFKAFRRLAGVELFTLLIIQGFAFDVEILYRAHRRGMTITEVPVIWRDMSGSTVQPLKHAITSTLSLVKIRVMTR